MSAAAAAAGAAAAVASSGGEQYIGPPNTIESLVYNAMILTILTMVLGLFIVFMNRKGVRKIPSDVGILDMCEDGDE